jgi:protocatechuate 3,4-dioxygenase beta subunit
MRYFVVAVVVLLLSPITVAAQPAAGFRAVVVDALTGVVLPRARVTAATTGAPAAPVFTDDRGELTLAQAAGVRELRVTKAGYAIAVVPVAAASAEPMVIALARGAAISGHLLDVSGAPAVRATIRAVPSSTRPGTPGEFVTRTDDLGEYRIGGLPEGRYSVAPVITEPIALGRGAFTGPRRPPVTASQRITLRAGDEVDNVDFAGAPAQRCQPNRLVGPLRRENGVVTGRVVATAGYPLTCASVRLLQDERTVAVFRTDPAGRYTIANVTPGEYTVEASHAGYLTAPFVTRATGAVAARIAVRERETVRDVNIILPHDGAITGVLLDERGEAIEGAQVRALQLRAIDGRKGALGVATAVTDDRGQYRLFPLPPGRYLVAAMPDDEISGQRTAAGYAATYYPGTPYLDDAASVAVEREHDRGAVDFARTRTRVATVTGYVYDTHGHPLGGSVVLTVSQRSGAPVVEPRTAAIGADGRFTFTNIPHGDYVVQAISGQPNAVASFGMQYVIVLDDNPAPVVVTTHPPSTVSGRLVIEGGGARPDQFGIAPWPSDFDRSFATGGGFPITRFADGSFRLDGVTGPRRITLDRAPRGWYLKSATLDGRDVADEPFEFGLDGASYDRLEVVVSAHGASIGGAVLDSRETGGCAVLVFSTDRAHWFRNSRHLKLGRPDADGAFALSGLPGGEYWVTAVDARTIAAGDWQDPALLGTLMLSAQRITLTEGGHLELMLRLNRAEISAR